MQWTCQDCGNEHGTSTVKCKSCGSWAVGEEAEITESSTGAAAAARPELNLSSSPDVNTDGSLKSGDAETRISTSPKSKSSRNRLRGGYYKVKAILKAPFHILWMYKAAIAAFVLVFGLAFFVLLGL